MAFPFADLDDSQFERLVVELMRMLFGMSVQSFATGPDGGRDARFSGTAEAFPSSADPWVGVTIGQAKHTNYLNAHFADAEFSSDASTSVLSVEIERIRTLRARGEIDHYFLASNRRLAAGTEEAIRTRLSAETGLPPESIYLVGEEYLDEMVYAHPQIVTRARVDASLGQLIPSSSDIANVILAIRDGLQAAAAETDSVVSDRVSYATKNRLNGLSTTFASRLKKYYLKDCSEIAAFLGRPENALSLLQYQGAVEDLELRIVAWRDQFETFDLLLQHVFDILIARDGILRSNARLTRALVFYMYWNSDIGKREDDSAG